MSQKSREPENSFYTRNPNLDMRSQIPNSEFRFVSQGISVRCKSRCKDKCCKHSGFEPVDRSCFVFCFSALCTAILFFPLSVALFLPQGFCTEKVFNEIGHYSVYRHSCHVSHVGHFFCISAMSAVITSCIGEGVCQS